MIFNLQNIFSSVKQQTKGAPQKVVGVDVGSSSIKVVELEQTEKAVMLRTYGELQLGPYAGKDLGESVTLEQEKLTEALVDVMRESSVTATNSVLTIPLSASFVTVIPIQTKGKETVESKLHVESRKYIPVPLSDVMLDWSELHEYGDTQERVHEVLLAAIQNDAYKRYQKLMTSMKMVSQPTEIEVFSTIRSLYRPEDTLVAMIDLGAETGKLYVANEGMLERIHRVYEGGATCTRRIADLLNVSFEDAENLKRQYTKDGEHARDIYRAYTSSVERSIQEFKRVIEQYEARQGEQVSRVVLTGGGAAFPGIEKYVSDLLSREVVYARPFSRVAYPAFMEDVLEEIGVSFTTALGAALRPFEVTE